MIIFKTCGLHLYFGLAYPSVAFLTSIAFLSSVALAKGEAEVEAKGVTKDVAANLYF